MKVIVDIEKQHVHREDDQRGDHQRPQPCQVDMLEVGKLILNILPVFSQQVQRPYIIADRKNTDAGTPYLKENSRGE